jgi:uncharacterized SAM-dependent methyltransferase
VRGDLADQVRRGLTASPKTLSSLLFYDEEGSPLYDQITERPESHLSGDDEDQLRVLYRTDREVGLIDRRDTVAWRKAMTVHFDDPSWGANG